MADPIPSLARHQAHVKEDGGWGANVVTVEDPEKGSVWLRICNTCFWIEATCIHEKNEWREEGDENDPGHTLSVLRCLLCGIDGT